MFQPGAEEPRRENEDFGVKHIKCVLPVERASGCFYPVIGYVGLSL